MKKLSLSIVTITTILIFGGCSVSDFSPEVVIPKAIDSVIQTKNKLYLSSNREFLEKVLKKQDIDEDEYNKLKELLIAAKTVKDYSTVKKITSFRPFKKRFELERAINKLLSTDYSKMKFFVYKRVYERGFLHTKEVPNDAVLKEIDLDLLSTYNKLLNLAKKYKMYSLEKKLKQSFPKIKRNYEIGLLKIFNYLMITNSYQGQSPKFILKVATKLFENNKTREAKTLIKSYARYKTYKESNFDIKQFVGLLNKYSYNKDAKEIEKYAKNMNKLKNIFLCSLENKKIKTLKIDAFGNKKTVEENGLIVLDRELSKGTTNFNRQKKVMFLFAEILALYKDKLVSKDNGMPKGTMDNILLHNFITVTLPILINLNKLPSTITLNKTLLTKNERINLSLSIKNIAAGVFKYIDAGNDWDLRRDRILALIAYLTVKNNVFLPASCNSYWRDYSTFVKHILIKLVDLSLNKHDTETLKLLIEFSNNDFNYIDKFLLSNNNIRKLVDIAKKHYFLAEKNIFSVYRNYDY